MQMSIDRRESVKGRVPVQTADGLKLRQWKNEATSFEKRRKQHKSTMIFRKEPDVLLIVCKVVWATLYTLNAQNHLISQISK